LEFVWKANSDLGKASDIFTGIVQLGYGYGSPPSMCWDLKRCNTESLNNPVVDNRESEEFNLKQKVDDLFIYTTVFSQHYTTNHVYVTFGGDFQFSSAQSFFKNIDKLIKGANERQVNGSKFNVFYSTPSCYLQALYQSNKTYQTKTDDFFPYGSDSHSYWTGYFSSRPALKYYDRRANNILQVCKQLNVLSSIKMDDQTVKLKEALGINQHHDAVSGTEKQVVAFDYALQLSKGIKKCEQVINKAYQKLLPKSTGSTEIPNQILLQKLNVSSREITENNSKFAITLYNPIARNVEQYIRIPVVLGKSYQVLSPSAQNISSDLISIPDYVTIIPERNELIKSSNEVVFKADIPALGFSTYFIKPLENSQNPIKEEKIDSAFTLKGKTIAVQFDSKGALESIKLSNGQTVSLKQSFLYYKGMKGDNKGPEHRASGAYVFRPDGTTPVNIGIKYNSTLLKGTIVTEVRQRLDEWVSQTIRVYPNEDYIEFDWIIGPIPEMDQIGKEVITRFDSNLTTNGFFYTDANGRQILERKRNFKPTYNVTVTEPIASNYYPVNSRIYMIDKNQDLQISLVNDRSQGGSSIQDGSLELMLHRRLFYDDAFGVHEALNEPGFDGRGLVIRGQTFLYLSKINSSARFHRDFSQRVNLSPVLTFSTYNSSETDYINKFKTSDSNLNQALPNNVNILTLEEWKNDSILLRLEHFYSSSDDPNGLSKNTTVDLSKLFKPFTIKSVSETTLGANQYLERAAKRLVFRTNETNIDKENPKKDTNSLNITLTPMQIRTFIVNLT
jgi:lysosomal alpha-mannosidase